MQGKMTIQDVARLAGVSKATVSRVLNHRSVTPELRERVMQVVQQHDFIPNIIATSLAGGRTSLIGVLAPPLIWPSIAELLHGVAAFLEETPYEMVLYSINFPQCDHSEVLDRFLALRMISGLLAIYPGKLAHQLITRCKQGLSLVMIDDQQKSDLTHWVGIDNIASAALATHHLLKLGHRRIAHVQGPLHYHCVRERYQGYCLALQEYGLSPDPSLVFQGNFTTVSGRQCATTLFARERAEWPTAIFATNDEMAYGVLEVADQMGIRVPEDISLLGFDDNLLSAYMNPPLTTIHQPFAEMGRLATQMLLQQINHPARQQKGVLNLREEPAHGAISLSQAMHIQLPTHLAMRASTAPPG
jgi:LacI family transcriptional regulator